MSESVVSSAPAETVSSSTSDSEVARRARHRIARRLLPFLFLLYVIAFLDRMNVGAAALQMPHDLGFSEGVIGFGAGIFFLGYFLLEIPGALIVERWSARRWIARIMISWGLVTVFMAFIHTARQFYLVRFLVGAAEAGFFPGVIVYLTHWFRYEDRAKAIAVFYAANPISYIIGSPLAGLLLGLSWLGLRGWRWLFIIEGIPAVLLGVITIFYLTDWPAKANWLPDDERSWITGVLQREKEAKKRAHSHSVVALIAQQVNGWHSDRTRERRWHAAVPVFLCGVGLALAVLYRFNPTLSIVLLVLGGGAFYGFQPCFWAVPTLFLGESAAAASIGLINSVGNLGGFVGPLTMGYLATRTHSFTAGLLYLVASLFLAGVLMLAVGARRAPVAQAEAMERASSTRA